MTNKYPRPTPKQLGALAARRGLMLRGMPYGPGPRQDDYIRGAFAAVEQAVEQAMHGKGPASPVFERG